MKFGMPREKKHVPHRPGAFVAPRAQVQRATRRLPKLKSRRLRIPDEGLDALGISLVRKGNNLIEHPSSAVPFLVDKPVSRIVNDVVLLADD